MFILLLHWLLSAVILLVIASLVPGFVIDSFGVAFFAALVLGLVNILIKPFLQLLTLPITLITLGLFSFVINAAMLGLTAWLTPGFQINGFIPALLGAILLSLLNYAVAMLQNNSVDKTVNH